jgi:N-sulfoglucosamine sulfohydrolase
MPLEVTRREAIQTAMMAAQTGRGAQQRPPNIIFLVSDDQSEEDLGCSGNRAVHTPNLDRLAAEGMRFTHSFATSPLCSPNRSAIFTGCIGHLTATSRLHAPLPDWEISFADLLQKAGYFAGAYRKVDQGPGFDRRWNYIGKSGESFDEFFSHAPAGKPFFLHVGFTDPHRPYKPGAFSPPHDPAKAVVPAYLPDCEESRKDIALYYDAIARMDAECGTILDILRRRNLEENTLVMFASDNGKPFARGKGTCYDPGLHCPLIARWPGRVKSGSVSHDLISHLDLPVTWLDAAGVEKGPKMQGRSFLDLMLGGKHVSRGEIFAERNWEVYFDPMRCIRTPTHKLIFNAVPQLPYRPGHDKETGPAWQYYLKLAEQGKLSEIHMRLLDPSRPMYELYDLRDDPNEFHNRATDPACAKVLDDLKCRLSDWMHETNDFLPPPFRMHPAAGSNRAPGYL